MTQPSTPTTLRAASYGRQSKARLDASAPQVQAQKTKSFADARGWQHIAHYEDIGASGYDPTASRPGLEDLLASVRRREVDVVVIYKLDRLTRQGAAEAVRLVSVFRTHGASLASVEEPYLDTSTPMGMGIFGLFAAMAEQESANISVRVRATKDLLRRSGSFAGGGRPFGYEPIKEIRGGLTLTILQPHPTEARVVAEVAANVLNGASIAGEVRRLNIEGIPTAAGSEWGTSTLSRLLQSPIIAGYMVARSYRWTAEKQLAEARQGPFTQQITRDSVGRPLDAWEPLVAPSDWHRLQEVIATRSGGRGPRPKPTLLGGSDLLHCASCGSRMGGDRRPDGKGSYRCMLHRRGSALCNGGAVSMPHLDGYLTRLVFERAIDLDPADPADLRILRIAAKRFNDRVVDPEVDSARRAAESIIIDAEDALNVLDDDRAAGVFRGDSGAVRYRRQAAALSDRAEAARAALTTLPDAAKGDDLTGLLDLLSILREDGVDFTSPESPWVSWSVEDRRDFLSLFLAEVTVSKATGHVGGDKVAWSGHKRLVVTWVDEVLAEAEEAALAEAARLLAETGTPF
jgi:site-specific DNA recombinase